MLLSWQKHTDNSEDFCVSVNEKTKVGPLVGQGLTGVAMGSQTMVDMGLGQNLAGSTDEL